MRFIFRSRTFWVSMMYMSPVYNEQHCFSTSYYFITTDYKRYMEIGSYERFFVWSTLHHQFWKGKHVANKCMPCESAHTCGGLVSELLQLHERGIGQFIQLQVFWRHEESWHTVHCHLQKEETTLNIHYPFTAGFLKWGLCWNCSGLVSINYSYNTNVKWKQ